MPTDVFSLGVSAVEPMLWPVPIGTLIAWVIVRFLAKNIQLQLLLAISLAVGILLSAMFYSVVWIVYTTSTGGIYTFSSIILKVVFAIIFFGPTLIILGPIVAGCLIQARRGRTFLSSLALYAASALCIVIQYFWSTYFLSG
jgi:hypothetical protein